MSKASLRQALKDLVEYVERNRCLHEETERGGVIWTICKGCGKKWADDEGGFRLDPEPNELSYAKYLLDDALEVYIMEVDFRDKTKGYITWLDDRWTIVRDRGNAWSFLGDSGRRIARYLWPRFENIVDISQLDPEDNCIAWSYKYS